MSTVLHEAFEEISSQLSGCRALAVVGLDGGIDAQHMSDPSFEPDSLSEIVTLLRIAEHTSEDTRAGRLLETSWTTEGALILARRVSDGNFLILLGDPELQMGFARYLLRRAAWQLRPQLQSVS
jgi:predicted regulator of Ras-like GTPase activity (Roadblock/LC7/MglB family)